MKRKLFFVLIIVLALAGVSSCSLLSGVSMESTTTIEEPSITFELPQQFYESMDNSYSCDEKAMFVDLLYFENAANLDLDAMCGIITYNGYYEEDILAINEVTIDGEDAYQVEYKTLSTGRDDIHYYFSGVMTFIELENEVLVVDGYVSMTESEGIDTMISSDDMQLLKDIADTIEITDEDYDNIGISQQEMNADNLTITLSDNWEESVADENGYYDFGYYASYVSKQLYIYYEIYEYNDDNITDMESAQATISEWENYTFVSEETFGGEAALVYKYEALESDYSYIYGMLVVTEHYWSEAYFYTYDDDYIITGETQDNIKEFILSAK